MGNSLFVPELLAAVLEEKLGENIKLYPLAKVESIEEKAGAVVTVPVVKYIGDAEAVAAGVAITPADYTQGTQTANIGKIAKAVSFTQEDINNNFIDLQDNAEKQLLKAISSKLEKDLFAALATIDSPHTATITTLNVDGLTDAVVPFGEELDDPMYLFVSPANLAALRKDDNFIVNAGDGDGVVASAGEIFGMGVVVSRNVPENIAYIVKQDAIALYLKKSVEVEAEKDIMTQKYNIVATQHYAVMLHDASKAVKVTIGG